MRETCLYCEQDGVRTVLVPTPWWKPGSAACPVHAKAWLESQTITFREVKDAHLEVNQKVKRIYANVARFRYEQGQNLEV